MPRTGDQFYPFRQDSTLFSLTGIEQPGTVLVLKSNGKRKQHEEWLFILPEDPSHTIWHGKRLSRNQAVSISAIHQVKPIDQLDKLLHKLIKPRTTVFINSPGDDKSLSAFSKQFGERISQLKKDFPSASIQSTISIYRELAMIKLPEEIDLLRKAITVTGEAFERVLQTVKPGMYEYEVEAELNYILSRNGCRHAFDPIIASGKSACTLHYVTNDRVIDPGTLILIDFGAEYANMASDMTRTIPADGRFNKTQLKFYQSVLHVLHEVSAMMRPGVLLGNLHKEAGRIMESELIRLKILSRREVKRQDKEKPLWKKYFMHGISHHLGYDVHDVSDRSVPLKEGMVLTCEPGLYIPKMKLGIRLENDILITKNGFRNLMASIPIEPEEIESRMLSKT